MDREYLYNKCAEFHGHSCGGLLIGFRAAICAMEQFGLDKPVNDEEIVCVSENNACGVDALQILLGCTAGKGNLIFMLRGKQAFTFFDRRTGKSFRIVLKEKNFTSREEKHSFMLNAKSEEIFNIQPAQIPVPQKAEIYKSQLCEKCGEKTAEPWLKVRNGKFYCIDCFQTL